ncbi:hypothetical protein [Halorussus aquaticus]|uniref:Uncharacterized protein n=1 Tax=Halorussus aquaticus TaxID=2953748 RepID=A0ABD5Q215_9EURY|nr:hypothetical protein [Halorussus aquaticus]
MALKKSLLKGLVVFAVVTLLVRKLGGERFATRVGVVTGGSIAVRSLLSADDADTEIEFEDEASVAE